MSRYKWRPYVPVARRRAKALKQMNKLRKKGVEIQPVAIAGRKIAKTFWGKAWCNNLESFSDYANRLPRGRTYVRNGSVCHLDISKGEINAIVSGSELYNVKIAIKPVARAKWKEIKRRCAGQIGSLLELLQGRLSEEVMGVVIAPGAGLLPTPREIGLGCSCPDWAVMCKHVAAVLYAVGARLDEQPDLLFQLRGLRHEELISADVGAATAGAKADGHRRIADDSLADVFGIEIVEGAAPAGKKRATRRKAAQTATKKKRKAKAVGAASRTKKSSSGSKHGPQRAKDGSPVTGRAVAKLRVSFDMSRSEFAMLLGVSATSISNWESRRGPLKLQSRTLEAWSAVKGLRKRQAWRLLRGSR